MQDRNMKFDFHGRYDDLKDIMMWIITEEPLNCTRESRQELLGEIRHMQNRASVLSGEWCRNICMNLSTLQFLRSLFHVPLTEELENIFGTGKIREDVSANDGVIYFEKEVENIL